jgi:hypothetical protein
MTTTTSEGGREWQCPTAFDARTLFDWILLLPKMQYQAHCIAPPPGLVVQVHRCLDRAIVACIGQCSVGVHSDLP